MAKDFLVATYSDANSLMKAVEILRDFLKFIVQLRVGPRRGPAGESRLKIAAECVVVLADQDSANANDGACDEEVGVFEQDNELAGTCGAILALGSDIGDVSLGEPRCARRREDGESGECGSGERHKRYRNQSVPAHSGLHLLALHTGTGLELW